MVAAPSLPGACPYVAGLAPPRAEASRLLVVCGRVPAAGGVRGEGFVHAVRQVDGVDPSRVLASEARLMAHGMVSGSGECECCEIERFGL